MSFQQGLSGINASAKNLDVIGNNIANSNTTGFKASRAEFSNLVASAVGSSDGGEKAGIGTEAVVKQQFSQGSVTATGNDLDVSINGNGFFKLELPDKTIAYSRAGNFKVDNQGNLITNSQAKVMGYPINPATGLRSANEAIPLVFPTGAPIAAKETRLIKAEFNLDARAKDAAGDPAATPPILATSRATYGTSINVYDSQGVPTPVNLYFSKTANANEWGVYTTLDETVQAQGSPLFTLNFDNTGKVTGPLNPDPYDAISKAGFYLANVLPTNNPNFPTVPLNNQTDPLNNPAITNAGVFLDLSGVTQYGNKFSVSDLSQTGYASGSLTGISIGDDGRVLSRYSNGVTQAEGQLALASFRNTQGLSEKGNNQWVETAESGTAVVGAPGVGNFGSLRSGTLEDSNVDLTAELVNMMVAQRAYQANAQTIKTQDQALTTLINLR
ncbi:MAG: flagellar hook protein FlgE [Burkholderiaceae bacterium]|nr:flagellar hook protein FlgE [Burkholderiaceae bacterium]